ncbi:hypothetical protein AKJ60_00650 [candidate division MSBL1 archaeon SCGC-AAA385M11]|nr:hypothetical protein AKJ60_00650 [candidate division MSBL1 archaeon SCGC-AAA385M11]
MNLFIGDSGKKVGLLAYVPYLPKTLGYLQAKLHKQKNPPEINQWAINNYTHLKGVRKNNLYLNFEQLILYQYVMK